MFVAIGRGAMVHIYTTYVHLCTPMYTYVHLCTPMYTYGHLCTPMYTYVHLCTPMYTYLQIIRLVRYLRQKKTRPIV